MEEESRTLRSLQVLQMNDGLWDRFCEMGHEV